jgi:hypothetical protein
MRTNPKVCVEFGEIADQMPAEEFNGQPQHVPGEPGRVIERQPELDAQERQFLRRREHDLEHEYDAEADQHWAQPAVESPDQDVVDEDSGGAGACHFRNGIDGLVQLCKATLQQDPLAGTVFAFRNRRATALKVLVYDVAMLRASGAIAVLSWTCLKMCRPLECEALKARRD